MLLSRRAFLASAAATASGSRFALPLRVSVANEPRRGLPLTRGVIIWRIGDLLEFDEQVAWVGGAGFEWLRKPRRDWIGATLDVGHMYFDHMPGYRPWDTIGGQIRYLDDLLFHLHLHDNTGTVDHIEIGTGKVDWDDTLQGLADIGYRGSMILEPNPDRVTPDGIRRSAAYLRQRVRELDLNV